ncbi:MAG: hypothetical protein V1722_04985 [Candidatus Micrarchaeota archaeon]
MPEIFERAKLQMAMLLLQEHTRAKPGFFGRVKKRVFSVTVPVEHLDKLFLYRNVNEPLRLYASTLVNSTSEKEQVQWLKQDQPFDRDVECALQEFNRVIEQPLHFVAVRGIKRALPKNTGHVELICCRSARQNLLRALAKDRLISFKDNKSAAYVSISKTQAAKLQEFIAKNSM